VISHTSSQKSYIASQAAALDNPCRPSGCVLYNIHIQYVGRGKGGGGLMHLTPSLYVYSLTPLLTVSSLFGIIYNFHLSIHLVNSRLSSVEDGPLVEKLVYLEKKCFPAFFMSFFLPVLLLSAPLPSCPIISCHASFIRFLPVIFTYCYAFSSCPISFLSCVVFLSYFLPVLRFLPVLFPLCPAFSWPASFVSHVCPCLSNPCKQPMSSESGLTFLICEI
jgi:hypothetical protein